MNMLTELDTCEVKILLLNICIILILKHISDDHMQDSDPKAF